MDGRKVHKDEMENLGRELGVWLYSAPEHEVEAATATRVILPEADGEAAVMTEHARRRDEITSVAAAIVQEMDSPPAAAKSEVPAGVTPTVAHGDGGVDSRAGLISYADVGEMTILFDELHFSAEQRLVPIRKRGKQAIADLTAAEADEIIPKLRAKIREAGGTEAMVREIHARAVRACETAATLAGMLDATPLAGSPPLVGALTEAFQSNGGADHDDVTFKGQPRAPKSEAQLKKEARAATRAGAAPEPVKAP